MGERDTEPMNAEVPPLREKANHIKATGSQKVKVREKEKIRVARVPRADALIVVEPTMHLHARRVKGAKPTSCKISSKMGKPINGVIRANGEPHGDNKANREPITRCPNPWDPTGPRECTQH